MFLILGHVWFCPKSLWSHLVHGKGPWYLVIFGLVQKVLKTFGPHQNDLDILCLISVTNPEACIMDQIHYWMFCSGSNIKDVLAWTKSLLDVLDMTKGLLPWIRFSSLATLKTKISLVCFVDSRLSGFKSFYCIWLHPVSVGTYAIFNTSCKVFCWGAQTLVVVWGLSFSMTCGILLPQLGTEPLSPALQGRFLASGPPARSQDSNLHCIISKPMLQFGFPGSSAGKESSCNARDSSSISESGRSPGEGIGYPLQCSWSSLVAQMVNNLPAVREIWVWSLGWEDPLEEGMATHSSILPGQSPWTEEPGGLQSMGLQRVRHNWATKHCITSCCWC